MFTRKYCQIDGDVFPQQSLIVLKFGRVTNTLYTHSQSTSSINALMYTFSLVEIYCSLIRQ